MSSTAIILIIGTVFLLLAVLGSIKIQGSSLKGLNYKLRFPLGIFGLVLISIGVYLTAQTDKAQKASPIDSGLMNPEDGLKIEEKMKADLMLVTLNVELTTKAWDAFNLKDYKIAIEYADSCINTFEFEAIEIQKRLEKEKEPIPIEGKPTSEEEKQKILSRGPLNDVASCYWIKGLSHKYLGQKAKANEAFKNLTAFKYALTYDNRYNGFWSPANKASAHIE